MSGPGAPLCAGDLMAKAITPREAAATNIIVTKTMPLAAIGPSAHPTPPSAASNLERSLVRKKRKQRPAKTKQYIERPQCVGVRRQTTRRREPHSAAPSGTSDMATPVKKKRGGRMPALRPTPPSRLRHATARQPQTSKSWLLPSCRWVRCCTQPHERETAARRERETDTGQSANGGIGPAEALARHGRRPASACGRGRLLSRRCRSQERRRGRARKPVTQWCVRVMAATLAASG